MTNHPELRYRDIKDTTLKKTRELLLNGDWNSLNIILKSSPNQIFLFVNILEFENKIFAEPDFIEPLFFERNDRHFLSHSIDFILNLMAENSEKFSDKFKEHILQLILPNSEELSGNAQEHINNALGEYLINREKENLTKYRNLFINLISKYPKKISFLIPKIVKLKWWWEVLRLILLEPENLSEYPSEIEELIKNNHFNHWDFNILKDLLEKYNESLYGLLLKEQELHYKEFIKDFYSLIVENLTGEWIREKGANFEYALNLFTNGELIKIIEKLLGFKISMSESSNSMFIHHCLYEISRMGKSILS